MIEQARQIQQLKKQIQQQSGVDYVVKIPQTNQKQISKQIISSQIKIRQLQQRQAQILLPKQSPIDMKLKNILASIRAVEPSGIINQQTFSPQEYRKLSIYPQISKVLMSRLLKLIQIQTQIDPIHKCLVKFPNTTYSIMQIVNAVITVNTIQQQFDALLSYYQMVGNQSYQTAKTEMLTPIFKSALNSIGKTNFFINQKTMNQILFDFHVKAPVYEQKITQIQTSSLQQIKKKNEKLHPNNEILTGTRKLLFDLVKRKRQQHIERNNFFSIVKPDQIIDYQQLVHDSITKQIQILQNIQIK